ncbi:hypothetical protein BD309DRAFT_450319 [Dichomitus squalens]|nr:hypothetical protein BD309DRAFT_450319 [Dichomitus squalens]
MRFSSNMSPFMLYNNTNKPAHILPMPPDRRRGVDVTAHGPASDSGDNPGLAPDDYIVFPLEAFETPGDPGIGIIDDAFALACSVQPQDIELELDPDPSLSFSAGADSFPYTPTHASPTSLTFSWTGGSYASPGGPPPSLSPTSSTFSSEPAASPGPISFSPSYSQGEYCVPPPIAYSPLTSPPFYPLLAPRPPDTAVLPDFGPEYAANPLAFTLPQQPAPPDQFAPVTCDPRLLVMPTTSAVPSCVAPAPVTQPDLQLRFQALPLSTPPCVVPKTSSSTKITRAVEAICPACGEEFTHKKNISAHLKESCPKRLHDGPRYPCPHPHCKSSYSRNNELNRHHKRYPEHAPATPPLPGHTPQPPS